MIKKVISVALVLLLLVSVVFSDAVVKEEDVVKLNTTQPIKPPAPEKKSSKYAKIKAAREAAERKLKELAAELESLKTAELDDSLSASAPAPASSAPAPLRAPEPKMKTAPAPSQTEKAAKLPSSEVVDMDGDMYMNRQDKAKYDIPNMQDKAKYNVQSTTGTSNASELYVGYEDEIPRQQQSKRRRVVKKVRSTDKKVRTKQQEDWDAAHHDVHEYDNSHWVEVDGEMTRLHTKSQTDVVDDRVYHGSEDEYAKMNGHQGHKIPDHEITKSKRRTNVTKRPRRKTHEELNGGFAAPQPTFYGMWTGDNLSGGFKAPVPGVYGGNKFKQGL